LNQQTLPEAETSDGNRAATVALANLVEPGNRELGQLVSTLGASQALARVLTGGVSASLAGTVATRLSVAGVAGTTTAITTWAEDALASATRLGSRIVIPGDDEWPTQLGDLVRISDPEGCQLERDVFPPLCLWVRGNVGVRTAFDQAVAVVGARAASDYGTYVASELGYGLADRQWSVVSGGAFGIDAAAHRGALTAGGLTVAVFACGIDRPYPMAHTSLFERIAEQGLLVSEWPPGAAPHRQRFLIRNRVIAAATRGTVMVEAAGRSGSRQTLRRARSLGRAPMAVPGPVTSAMSVGCHTELRETGATRLVTSTAEVIEEVGRIGELAPIPRGVTRPYDGLDPVAARVLEAVRRGQPQPAEELAATAGVSGSDARRVLPSLVAGGFVEVVAGGYRLARARPRQPGSCCDDRESPRRTCG
jgi:DNA processing protein